MQIRSAILASMTVVLMVEVMEEMAVSIREQSEFELAKQEL